jgi:hypothetical protein
MDFAQTVHDDRRARAEAIGERLKMTARIPRAKCASSKKQLGDRFGRVTV